jgi:hypothetical protein
MRRGEANGQQHMTNWSPDGRLRRGPRRWVRPNAERWLRYASELMGRGRRSRSSQWGVAVQSGRGEGVVQPESSANGGGDLRRKKMARGRSRAPRARACGRGGRARRGGARGHGEATRGARWPWLRRSHGGGGALLRWGSEGQDERSG